MTHPERLRAALDAIRDGVVALPCAPRLDPTDLPRETLSRLAGYAVARGWARAELLAESERDVCTVAYGLQPLQRMLVYEAERRGGLAGGLEVVARFAAEVEA